VSLPADGIPPSQVLSYQDKKLTSEIQATPIPPKVESRKSLFLLSSNSESPTLAIRRIIRKTKAKPVSPVEKLSTLIKRRLRTPQEESNYKPCTSQNLSAGMERCKQLADHKNAASIFYVSHHQNSHKQILKQPSYATMQRKLKRQKLRFFRAKRRFPHLYAIFHSKQHLYTTSGLVRRVNFGSKGFEFKRLYFPLFINGNETEAQLDSGADCNLISHNILQVLLPKWDHYKFAGHIRLTSVNDDCIRTLTTRWLPMSLSLTDKPKLHKVVIIRQDNTLLLGSEFIHDLQLGLVWKPDSNNPYLTTPRMDGSKNLNYFPTSSSTCISSAKNTDEVTLQPSEEQCRGAMYTILTCKQVKILDMYRYSVPQSFRQISSIAQYCSTSDAFRSA